MTRTGMGAAVDAYDVYGAYRSMRATALAKAFVKGAVVSKKAAPAAASAAAPAGAPAIKSAEPPLEGGAVAAPKAEAVGEVAIEPTYHA